MEVTFSEIADAFQDGLDFVGVNQTITSGVDEVEKLDVGDFPILKIFDHLKHSLVLK